MSWSDVTPTSSTWSHINEGETVWDAGATQWDLNGNTYQTPWDAQGTTWATQAGNSVTWNDV